MECSTHWILSWSAGSPRGCGVRPNAALGTLGLHLGEAEAALERGAEPPAEPCFGKSGANQLFVQEPITVPGEDQVAAIVVEAFGAECKFHAAARLLDKIFRKLAGLGTPRFDGIVLADCFRRVDTFEPDTRAGRHQQRVAVDHAADPVDAFREHLAAGGPRRRTRHGREHDPLQNQQRGNRKPNPIGTNTPPIRSMAAMHDTTEVARARPLRVSDQFWLKSSEGVARRPRGSRENLWRH